MNEQNRLYSEDEFISSEQAPKFDKYVDYVEFCKQNNVNNYFTEEQWNLAMEGKLKFSPNPMLGGMVQGFATGMLNRAPIFAAAAQSGGIRSVTNLAMQMLKDEGANVASDFLLNLKDKQFAKGNNNDSTPPGKGSKSEVLPTGGTKNNPNNLLGSYDVNPITLDLKPGLLNRTYVNSVNYPVDRACYSHITGYKIQIPGSTAVKFFFDNVIIPWLKNAAQQAVNFRVDQSLLESTKIINYINTIIDAYSLLFFTTSILSYTSVPSNKDRGTFALRSMISATDIDYLNQLKALLSVMPAPPALVNVLFWLYQTYTDGDNSQAVYRLMPISFNPPTDTARWSVTGFTGASGTAFIQVINSLNTADNLAISSLLTQVTPGWLNNNIKDCSPVAIYSKSWMTLFGNAISRTFFSTTNYVSNVIGAATTELRYFSFDPTLDGLILGLSTVGVGSSSPYTYRPFLGQDVSTSCVLSGTTYLASRFSYTYSTSANDYLWRPSNFTIESAFGRNDVAIMHNDTFYYRNPTNAFFVRGVTAELLETSALDTISYLMSINSIKNNKSKGNTWQSDKSKSKSKSKTGS